MNQKKSQTLTPSPAGADVAAYSIGTEQFAANNRVKPGSVRHRLCLTGSYFGVLPKKLKNGRLVWPDIQVGADA